MNKRFCHQNTQKCINYINKMDKNAENDEVIQGSVESLNTKQMIYTPSTNNSTQPTKINKQTTNNQPTSPTLNCLIIPAIKETTVINQLFGEKIVNIGPIKGTYHKNRPHFFNWIRNQSVKLQLSRQTFGGAVFMMDYYYKQNNFNSNDFSSLALSMLIISSKLNQSKVLYTPVMAKKIKIDPQRMEETQIFVMKWFKFKVNAYNFARVIMNYMKVWDDMIKIQRLQTDLPLFFQQKLSSYLLFQQIFYVCEQQLKLQNQLLTSTLKIIIQEIFIAKFGFEAMNKYLQKLFAQKQQLSIFSKQEIQYAYEYLNSEDELYKNYIQALKEKILIWRKDFQFTKQGLTNRFIQYTLTNKNYGKFIGAQI